MSSTLFNRGVNGQFGSAIRRSNELDRNIQGVKQAVDSLKLLSQDVTTLRGHAATVDARLAGIDGRNSSLENRVAGVERRIEALDATLKQILERLAKLETTDSETA